MRLIDAEALWTKLLQVSTEDKLRSKYEVVEGIDKALHCVSMAPTIEAKPVVHAHWEKDSITSWEYCSHCGVDAPFSKYTDDVYESMFCPACGAQMDSSETGGDAL